ncbi:hypothetical protein TNCV_4159471 [Trichonephila clavipes]|nr:hypothetical protein TNCV_4159471 [Trichonephila clavipes]
MYLLNLQVEPSYRNYAVIKRTYAHIKRDNWNKLRSTLDPRVPNSKLWNLVKSISREQPQVEKHNTIQDANCVIP